MTISDLHLECRAEEVALHDCIAHLEARIEVLENPTIKRQVFAAKMLATFTQPDVDCYLLAGIIYTAMQEPKMAAALLKETDHE